MLSTQGARSMETKMEMTLPISCMKFKAQLMCGVLRPCREAQVMGLHRCWEEIRGKHQEGFVDNS